MVTIKDWNGRIQDYEFCEAMMDVFIRENIHFEFPNLTPQEFYDEYCQRHYEEYGENFEV